MKITKFLAMIAIIIVLVLAACSGTQQALSSAQQSGSQQTSDQQASTQQANNSQLAGNQQSSNQQANSQQDASAPQALDQSFEEKLAVGTLKLEGTDQAVTAEQASTLLPLWKAVKSLSSSDTISQDEITALYDQIKEVMTDGQVQAIENLNLTQEDMTALMESLGIQAPQGNPANMDDNSRATRQAQMPAPSDGGQPPEGGVGGGPGGNPMGDMPGGGQPDMQGTPPAGMGGRRPGGINTLFVDPLIQLLEERASS